MKKLIHFRTLLFVNFIFMLVQNDVSAQQLDSTFANGDSNLYYQLNVDSSLMNHEESFYLFLERRSFDIPFDDTLLMILKTQDQNNVDIYYSDTLGLLTFNSDKVFIQELNNSSFELLYDFSLNIGDTAYYDELTQEYAIVIDTPTQEVFGSWKSLLLSNGDEWVRGIGSLRHPVRHLAEFPLVNYNLCVSSTVYSLGYGNFYVHYYSNDECRNVGIENTTVKNFKIYPNPIINNNFTIETDESLQINALVLYDLHGSKINLLDVELTGNKFNIQLPQISTGIYFLKIDTDNGIINKKIQILN